MLGSGSGRPPAGDLEVGLQIRLKEIWNKLDGLLQTLRTQIGVTPLELKEI
jgi:hypothetical protein